MRDRQLNSARALRKAYEDDELSCREIATLLGGSIATAWRRLKAAGVKFRRRGSVRKGRLIYRKVHPYHRVEIARRFIAGEPAAELAIEFGVTTRYVYWARDKYQEGQKR